MKFSPAFLEWYKVYISFMGIIGHSLYLFQAARIWSTGSAHDVSLIGFIMAFIAMVSWLIYGIMVKDKAIIRVNIAGVTFAFICLVVIILKS
jgi:MtN3 and saliva related transmembrane protein